jgi:hypothetical protein
MPPRRVMTLAATIRGQMCHSPRRSCGPAPLYRRMILGSHGRCNRLRQGNCIWTPFEAHVGDEASGWLVSKDTLITKDPFFGPEWGQIGQMQLPCRLRQVVPYEPGRVRLSPIALATPFRRTRWVYCSKIRPSASSHHPWFMVEWTHHKNEGQSPRCERLVIQRWEKRPWESTVILHGKEKRVTGQSAIVVPHCAIVESQDAFIRRVGDPGWQRVRVPL